MQDKKTEEIRERLTYIMPSGLTDSEWKKITEKIGLMIDTAYKSGLDKGVEDRRSIFSMYKNTERSVTDLIIEKERQEAYRDGFEAGKKAGETYKAETMYEANK